ncbi:M16 family metallopeptidase [Brevundimonas sp.]|uniref:M16 family metallopeptidase n=1 Tax=Brevundimonas sp. TaxID=1871086 RepID=UPI003D0CB424
MTFRRIALAGTALVALGLSQPAWASMQDAVPVQTLVQSVSIPYESFTLDNGLRVIVHTDRSVPLVSFHVIYDVGARHEPAGKSGFAHLFEHLMFSGSENAPGDFFTPLKAAGVTANNGMTQPDKTSYYETVPTPALERVLFLESDRMGHLLGAITQQRLDEQRAVVKNEKRQGDNEPAGLVEYKLTEGLYPADHPYGHSVIGSMADLDAATLDDVKSWFQAHYGPNNATVTLAGDIDVATARRLMTQYFGDIPSGPRVVSPPVTVPTLPARKNETMTDRVSATTLVRAWAVPGRDDPQGVALEAAAGLLGALGSSPLQQILVRDEKLFTGASASASLSDRGGMFIVAGELAEGVDPIAAGQRLDAVIADFLAKAPTADDLQRYVTLDVTGSLSGIDAVSDRGYALADGSFLSEGPDYFKDRLVSLAAQTPSSVQAVAKQWLSRPVYALTLAPGPRVGYVESEAADVVASTNAAPQDVAPPRESARGPMPPVGDAPTLTFPQVARPTLSNGLGVEYVHRAASPISYVSLEFDAGSAAEQPGRIGAQTMLLDLLDKGTLTRSQTQFANELERLGGDIRRGASKDRTSITLSVPTGNLSAAIDLMADMARNPAFAPDRIELQRTSQLAAIADEATDARTLGDRRLIGLLNAASPYVNDHGAGDEEAVRALSREDLVAFQHAWLRPDKARIFVVSSAPLDVVQPLLEENFGDWRPTGPAGVKDFTRPAQSAAPQLVLIDRPDSAQSVILAGQYTGLRNIDDILTVDVANDGLGGGILGRLNTDLRERKGWTYGVSAGFRAQAYAANYTVAAPVQSDKTGATIQTIRQIVASYIGDQPMTQAELTLSVESRMRSMPAELATSKSILDALRSNAIYQRPDSYFSDQLAALGALRLDDAQSAIRTVVNPDKFVWVVVGDAEKVLPQLQDLNLPIQVVRSDAD